jgi:hypothetical protein
VDGGHDVDRDGVPDILVGSPFEHVASHYFSGRVSLYSGANGSLLWMEGGPTSWEFLGASVAFLGDLDGRGSIAWVAGAPEDRNPAVLMGAGHVRVFSGPSGRLLKVLTSRSPTTSGFGACVQPAGDVDGDGITDLLVGMHQHPRPGARGWIEVFSPGRGFRPLLGVPVPVSCIGPCPVQGAFDHDADGISEGLLGSSGTPGFTRLFRR